MALEVANMAKGGPLVPRKSLDGLPQTFVSTSETTNLASKAVTAGKLRKLASRLYTRDLNTPPEAIVRRDLWAIVAGYFPAPCWKARPPGTTDQCFWRPSMGRPMSRCRASRCGPGAEYRHRTPICPLRGACNYLLLRERCSTILSQAGAGSRARSPRRRGKRIWKSFCAKRAKTN